MYNDDNCHDNGVWCMIQETEDTTDQTEVDRNSDSDSISGKQEVEV